MTKLIVRRFSLSASFMAILLGTAPALSAQKPITFYGEQNAWRLIVDTTETRFDERPSRFGQLWTTQDLRQGSFREGVSTRSTFWSTHVVAGEAVDQPMNIVIGFVRRFCRDRRGRLYPLSVVLRFDDNPEVWRGCGKRLP